MFSHAVCIKTEATLTGKISRTSVIFNIITVSQLEWLWSWNEPVSYFAERRRPGK